MIELLVQIIGVQFRKASSKSRETHNYKSLCKFHVRMIIHKNRNRVEIKEVRLLTIYIKADWKIPGQIDYEYYYLQNKFCEFT